MKKNPPRREDQPDRFRVISDWYSLISKSAEPKTNTKGQRLDLDRLLRPKTNDMIGYIISKWFAINVYRF